MVRTLCHDRIPSPLPNSDPARLAVPARTEARPPPRASCWKPRIARRDTSEHRAVSTTQQPLRTSHDLVSQSGGGNRKPARARPPPNPSKGSSRRNRPGESVNPAAAAPPPFHVKPRRASPPDRPPAFAAPDCETQKNEDWRLRRSSPPWRPPSAVAQRSRNFARKTRLPCSSSPRPSHRPRYPLTLLAQPQDQRIK